MTSAGIWDWADKISEAIHKEDAIRTLSRQVARHECGDCSLWMTRSCLRERQDNKLGMGRGGGCDAVSKIGGERLMTPEHRAHLRALAERVRTEAMINAASLPYYDKEGPSAVYQTMIRAAGEDA